MPPAKNSAEDPQGNGSGEVAARDAGTIAAPRMAIQFRDYLMAAADADSEDSFKVMAGQLEKILQATTYDEVMDADSGGTFESRDLIDLEVELHDTPMRIAKSAEQFDSTLGVYVQFYATALTGLPGRGIVPGADLLISSGAPLIIGKRRTLEANGLLPCRVRFIGIQTPNGVVMKLGKPLARAATGTAE